MPYIENAYTPGAVNGHYLFETAAIIHRVISPDRPLKAEQADALICLVCGALQLFLVDAENGQIGNLGIREQPDEKEAPTVLTDKFLELQRGALLRISAPFELVDYILGMAWDLRAQLDKGAFPHDEVIGRARQFLMTTCGIGKMPLIGFYAKNQAAIDPSTYKIRMQQAEWGLIGVGLLTLSASRDVSGPEFDGHTIVTAKVLGSTILGKALF
jgi:hypothetical protein